MSTFKKGDKVRLVSGGPRMAVANLGDYSTMGTGPQDGVLCQWFATVKGVEQPQERVFDAAVLELDKGDEDAARFRAARRQ